MKNKYMQNKWIRTLALGVLVTFGSCSKDKESEIDNMADFTAISDSKFEQALIDLKHDTKLDGKVLTSVIQKLKKLNVSGKGITNLKGIESFASLEDLTVRKNTISYLDLSKNTKLMEVDASENGLDSINLSKNTLLKSVSLESNKLKKINLSSSLELIRLRLNKNLIQSLNVSANKKLALLFIKDNQLKQIDLSKNTVLTDLMLHGNKLKGLDLSKNTLLKGLYIKENSELTCIKIAANFSEELANLGKGAYSGWQKDTEQSFSKSCEVVDAYLFTAIPDVNFEKALIALGHDDVKDGRILTAKAKEVKQLDVHEKEISNLTGLQAFENITDLNGQGNSIKAIDLSKNLKLKTINLSDNQLTGVDISPLTNLTVFNAKSNSIQSLDVSANEKLNSLFLKDNKLQHIDLSKNTLLRDLILEANKIKHLDLSKNTGLKAVNIKGNAELTCVKIADNFTEEGANSGINAYSGWIKDSGQRFSKDCAAPDPSLYTAIPDQNFEQVLIDLGWDDTKDGRVLTANVKDRTDLNIGSKDIKNIKGIEAFKELKTLDAGPNKISSIDLSANIKLETIDLQHNLLTSIDVSKNTKLETLNISNNALASIDVSKLTELKALLIIDCGITQVNISRNTALTKFMAARNSLTSLDLSKNTSIQTLWLTDNKLKTLDLSNNTNLLHIQIQKNTLTDLDLSANTKLGQVLVSQNPKLNCIGVSRGQTSNGQWVKDTSQSFSVDCSAPDPSLFTAIPDTKFEEALIELGLDDVKDGRILTATAKEVIELNIYRKGISKLTGIQAFTKLTRLYAGANSISQVDLSKNLNLEILKLDRNQLSSIDISKLTKLTQFDPSVNQLQSVDLENSLALTTVNLYSNKISQIDVSKNVKLTYLAVSRNELQDLDISKNVALTNVHVGENSSLTCIQVASQDIADGANAKTGRYTNWNKDDSQRFSVDCSAPDPSLFTAIPDLSFERELIRIGWDDVQDGRVLTSNIQNKEKMDVSARGISNLKGIEAMKELTELRAHSNTITSIDLSSNTKLKIVTFENNRLSAIDLSNNKALTYLNLRNNKLVALDISNQWNLVYLFVAYSPTLTYIKLVNEVEAGKANAGRGKYQTWSLDSHQDFVYGNTDPASQFTTIPDSKFESYFQSKSLDKRMNGRVFRGNLTSVTVLATGLKIKDFTGIEALVNLEEINLFTSSATTLNLSNNSKLKKVEIASSPLNEIHLPNSNVLTHLDLVNNNILQLDLTNLPNLSKVKLWSNANLSCIKVASQAVADGANSGSGAYSGWAKGASQRFSVSCPVSF